MLSPKSSTWPPISVIFAVIDSKCFVIQFFIKISPFVATAASINVPASIWSGTTEYVALPVSFFTPLILITSVPAPRMSAPIVFKKLATSTMWGSLAALSIIVVPSARTEASITLIVAPTETTSIYIEVPTNFDALAVIFPWVVSTFAPKASKPLICWSIGLAPNLQPPGIPTVTAPLRPSILPII